MMRHPPYPIHLLLFPVLLLVVSGCQAISDIPPPEELVQVNAAINQQGQRCPRDYCLDDWPEATELKQLEYWDCKAYAVAKADRLIHQHHYDPARLEYLLISGPPLRVIHTALLVDGQWVLDMGIRCQVCELALFTTGLRVSGRLPVVDLPYVRRAFRAASIL